MILPLISKNQISEDILNYELSILYRNKIYGQDAQMFQAIISLLAENIDDILNKHRDNCLEGIKEALEQGKMKLAQFLYT